MAGTSAYLADVLGRKRTLLVSLLIALVVGPLCLLVLFPSGNPALVMLGAFLFEIPVGGQGAFFPLFAESFSTKYRQIGAGLSYQTSNLWLAIILIVVVPWFYATFGLTGLLVPLTVLSLLLTCMGLIALRFSRETKGAVEADFEPQPAAAEIRLAPRVSLAELQEGPILFYNNSKLDFCNYNEVFVRLNENFAALGITNFVDVKETVRGKTSQDLKAYGAGLVKRSAPKAAIVALGDMGIALALRRLE